MDNLVNSSQNADEMIKNASKFYTEKKYNEAIDLYSQAIEINPMSEEAFFNMANIFHQSGKIGKAIKAFQKVLTINPDNTDASISLSILYNDIGKYDQAQVIFDTANEKVKHGKQSGIQDPHVNKKFSGKHYELAEMYFSYNRHDEALFEYDKASKLDPENLELRIKIAKVYAKKGFTGKAFEELRKLKNEKPEYIKARLSLGVLYYSCGKVIEAQNEWKNVLAQDPANKEAKNFLNLSETATETTL